MLGKPINKKTMISFHDTELGNASNKTDVPIIVMAKLIARLNNTTHRLHLEFEDDEETFGIVEFGKNLYAMSDKRSGMHGENFCYFCYMNDYPSTDDIIVAIAKEVIDDIETHFEDWLFWEYSKEEFTLAEAQQRSSLLRSLQKLLKESVCMFEYERLPELGNLLFGNSRGEYPVRRSEMELPFLTFMENAGFDTYGHAKGDLLIKGVTERGGFENNTFSLNPYYWGDDEQLQEEPNFVYKPTGLEIQWYKWPFRDAYSNKEFTREDLEKALRECMLSLTR